MKTPPLLLLATLLFWGWQSQLLLWGALAGVALEAARALPSRWDLEDVEFSRIWSFCAIILLALGGYVFTNGAGGEGGLLHGGKALGNLSSSSSLATNSVLRWLPLVFLPFVIAQVYNVRSSIPLSAISLTLRMRQRRGEPARYADITYAYFILCLFSSGIHANQGSYYTQYGFLGGQLGLIFWALWTLRSGRFGLQAWLGGLVIIGLLGFAGQVGIGQMDRAIQNLDARLFAHFLRTRNDPTQATTSLGHIGQMKLSPRIVIRLTPGKVGVVPTYLQEACYRIYDPRNRSWAAGGGGFVAIPGLAGNTCVLLPGKTANDSVKIACYLNGMAAANEDNAPQGVLPLPSGTCRLENLPGYTILETNQAGTVVATGSELMIFDASYGPGAIFGSAPDLSTNHSPDLSTNLDLAVPTNELPALQQVIAEMNVTSVNLTNASYAAKRQAVAAFFARNFTYSTWQGPEKRGTPNASPLTRFLLTSRSGHCEYFATATVLLLRQLHIPARYAVGYSVHENSGTGFVVRERDAHAWCLAWNEQTRMWEDFDTTPGSWIAIESRNAPLDWLSDLWSWTVFQFEKLRWGESNLQQYILWMFVPVILVLLFFILFRRRQRARAGGKTTPEETAVWPGRDSAFYRLEAALAARGLPRQPPELLSAWLERTLTEPALAAQRGPLRELLQLHYRHRFDPHGLSSAQKQSLTQNTEAVLAALSQIKAGE